MPLFPNITPEMIEKIRSRKNRTEPIAQQTNIAQDKAMGQIVPQGGTMPQEYTPEITEEFRRRLAEPITQRMNVARGRARSEALARGLTGDPFESLAVGAAERGGERAMGDLEANLSYNLAGLQREERLGRESRQFGREERLGSQEFSRGERLGSQEYGAGQATLDRQFRERLAALGYQQAQEEAQSERRRSRQSDILGGAFTLGGSALGGPIGGAIGKWLSNKF